MTKFDRELDPPEEKSFLGFQTSDRVELLSTIVLAFAVILTAWSAFQSAKWSGIQAIQFSEAGAARTAAARSSLLAGQQAQLDATLFVDWITALDSDTRAGLTVQDPSATVHQPTPGTVSGFLFLRMRDEFVPALQAWLATDPIDNPDAAATPFELPEYQLANTVEAERLTVEADDKASQARQANRNSDTYVVSTVLFAAVLFFAGVSSKMAQRRNRILVLSFGVIVLIGAAVVVGTLPIERSSFEFF